MSTAAPQPEPHVPAGAPALPRDRSGQDDLLRVLMALTLLSGLVDAVCYLGLGRGFTANMTGNVVGIGFAAAGAPGFSIRARLTWLLVFLVGAVAGGRISQHLRQRSHALTVAISLEAGFVGAAAV